MLRWMRWMLGLAPPEELDNRPPVHTPKPYQKPAGLDRDDNSCNSEKLRAVVDLVDKEEWLLLLHIDVLNETDSGLPTETSSLSHSERRRLSVQVSPHTTAKDVKALVYKRLGIPWEYQRLYRQNNTEPFFWNQTVLDFAAGGGCPENTVHVRVTKRDPQQQALFTMVGLGCPKDRDERMMRLTVGRNPGQCPKGHILPVYKTRYEAPCTPEPVCCAVCCFCPLDFASAHRDDMELILCPCQSCGDWAMCNYCLLRDVGLDLGTCGSATREPYQVLDDLALELAHRRMKPACWFEDSGRERVEFGWSHPRVCLDNELVPRRYGHWTHPTEAANVTTGMQVILAGATLKFRVQPEIRSVLLSMGEEDAVKSIEEDVVLDSGATIGDLITIRGNLRKRSQPCWDLIGKGLRNLPPAYDPPHSCMSVVSYRADEVVLELGAFISDGDY